MFDLSKRWPPGFDRRTIGFLAIGFAALLFALYWGDAPLSNWAQALPRQVRSVFGSITNYGLSDWILIPSLGFFAVCYLLSVVIPNWTPKLALRQMAGVFGFIFAGVGLPGLLSNLLKRLIGRGRPRVFDDVGDLSFQNIFNDFSYQSFPSGHTTTAFAFAFVIGFLSPRWLPAVLVAAVAVGLSRVVVGAHYPTDVAGGIVVGTLGAYAVRNFFAGRGWVFRPLPDGGIGMRKPSAIRRLIVGRKRGPAKPVRGRDKPKP